MRWVVLRWALAALSIGFGTCALAQGANNPDSVRESSTVYGAKPVRIAVVNNLKKDCSVGPMPEIKVTDVPRNGTVTLKAASIKTGKKNRCPDVQAQGRVVIYRAKPEFAGEEHLTIEVRTAEGESRTHTVRIKVTGDGLPAGQKRI